MGQTAVVTGAALVIGIGIELRYGELHFAEDRAGIVVFAGLAVLFGETEVGRGEHKLNTALHTDHREYTDGDVYAVHTHAVDEIAVEFRADLFGDSVDTHTAVTELTATLHNLAIKADGRCNLNYDGRQGGFAVTAEILFIKAEAVFIGIGSEHRNVLFASVENDLLIEGAKTLYLLNSAAANAGFESYTEIITHGYLIEAFIKGYGLDVDIGVDHLNTFTSDRACFIDNFLTHIAKMNTYIFKTVFIAGRIENLINAYAAKLFGFVTAETAQGTVSFNH